jgi:hypothetical protein
MASQPRDARDRRGSFDPTAIFGLSFRQAARPIPGSRGQEEKVMGNTQATRSSLKAVSEKFEQKKLAVPAERAPLLAMLGLTSQDGAGELAFCTKGHSTSTAFLLDMSKAWDPDGDGDLAARCRDCDAAHWTIPFVQYLQDCDSEWLFSGGIAIAPELLLAQTIENLRAKATARAVAR